MIENIFKNQTSLPWLKERTMFLVRSGSHAYGTNIASSDEDLKGFAVPPKEYFTGFVKKFDQAVCKTPDAVIYGIQKFFNLAADCNPSIIEVLFTDPCDVLIGHPAALPLIINRNAFLSKKAKFTFSGYAISQLKRIQTHRRWLLNPLEHEPTRVEYGLQEVRAVSKEQFGAAEANIKATLNLEAGDPTVEEFAAAAKGFGYEDNFIEYIQREQRFRRAKQEWVQYCTWKAERNAARAETERKFGYDTKHAMHLCRLLTMCKEILTGGGVIVKRPDAHWLLGIRNGAWSYDELMAWASNAEASLEALYTTSRLLHTPDRNFLDSLCMQIVEKVNG